MCCKCKHIVHRHKLYVAKTYIICCKNKIYMLQRQSLYAAKTNLYVIKTNLYVTERNMYVIKIRFMCYKEEFMLYKQDLYVIKTKFICCKDKKHGARAERARRGFFLPEKDIIIFGRQYSCFCLVNRQNTS